MRTKNCFKCEEQFDCGVGTGQCWCMSYPPIMVPNIKQDCLCSSCLGISINERVGSLIEEGGMKSFQKLAEPYRSPTNILKGIDYTIEAGLYVFTKWYLARRGECCNNGCKNCPY